MLNESFVKFEISLHPDQPKKTLVFESYWLISIKQNIDTNVKLCATGQINLALEIYCSCN